MQLFGGNLKALILGYEGLFASIGFDFKANAEKPDSLKAFVDGKTGEATTAATNAAYAAILKDAGVAAVEGKPAAESIKAALAAKDAQLAIYTTGLTAAGVTPKPAKDGEALTAANVQAAVEARASQKGAAIAAATGHEAIAQAPAGSGANAESTNLEEIQAQIATTRDPVKAGQLAARANALRDKRWAGGSN